METDTKRIKNSGQAIIVAILFFTFASSVVLGGVAAPVLKEVSSSRELFRSRESFAAAEGLLEDVTYRLRNGVSVSDNESLSIGAVRASATTTNVGGTIEVIAAGDSFLAKRNSKATLQTGEGASFFYGIQSGEGGIHLKNTSSVVGNVFSNGPVTGANSNLIKGDVISGGPAGLLSGVHATSSGYAHTIQNSTLNKNAYYQTISGTTVLGTLYPGSQDQATSTLPISDSQVEEWKNDAAAGGSVTCAAGKYNISGSITIGPKKIPCDLNIDGSDQVTLAGPLWVTGNIDIANTASVRVSAALGANSVAVVADNPADRINSSKINLKNSATFYGSGHANSYILFISQNRSARDGGSELAIEVQNGASGKLLVYAGSGEIDLKNSVNIKEVTAYKITLQNSAQVIYETGLANLLFSAGPAGGYKFGSWREVE
ncbi:MAG: hypothetical protein UX94_C0009G0012 [Parcubacteria group bacterium GW2011_GWA2_47_21]|nr:MAG: hypothetical protein UX94_C0009G0012 [Parcubacteria group bacterium GW2011_GWA2_47_21]